MDCWTTVFKPHEANSTPSVPCFLGPREAWTLRIIGLQSDERPEYVVQAQKDQHDAEDDELVYVVADQVERRETEA